MSSTETGRGSNIWVLILAAGQGARLSSLTTDASGVTVPKQFCSLSGGPSLLHMAVQRARTLAPAERICVVVAEEQRHWWQPALGMLPARNVVVQPRNCGTGNGILLALLAIMERDPQARIAVLPSDHYVSEERVLARALAAAMEEGSAHLVLLGITPVEPDPELGYIVPEAAQAEGTRPVARFVEKPPPAAAARLIAQGGLWNSLIFAASAATLLRLFQQGNSRAVAEMRTAVSQTGEPYEAPAALHTLYQELPTVDFSRDVLESASGWLRVRAVEPCGWSDLGTVPRVTRVLGNLPPHTLSTNQRDVPYDLAAALRRRQQGRLLVEGRPPHPERGAHGLIIGHRH